MAPVSDLIILLLVSISLSHIICASCQSSCELKTHLKIGIIFQLIKVVVKSMTTKSLANEFSADAPRSSVQ